MAKDKHLAELAARKDTKKLQKRRARDERLRAKEEELIEASMDVDGQVKSKKSADEKLGLALKKVGAGKKKYQKFLGQKAASLRKEAKARNPQTAVDSMED